MLRPAPRPSCQRGAGQRSHVVGEMRLIGVATYAATAASGTPLPGKGRGVAEAQDAPQQLRAVAERVERPALELA